jgi:hypothetical protein
MRTGLSRETTLLHIAELAAHLHVLGLGPTSLLAGGLGRPGEGIALLPIRACVHGSGGAESGIVVGDKGAGGRVVGAVEVGGVFTGEGRVGAEEGVLSVIRLPEGEVGLVFGRAGEAAWGARLGRGADDEGSSDEAGDGQEAEHGLYGMGKECKEC